MRAPTEVPWALPQGQEELGMGPYVSPNTPPPSEHLCSYGPDGVGSTKDFTGKTCFVGLRGRQSPLWNRVTSQASPVLRLYVPLEGFVN